MKKVRLMWAASEHEADMLYATRFFAPDAFLWWQEGEETHGAFNALELDRAKATARIDHVHQDRDFLGEKNKDRRAHRLILAVARARGFRSIEVPGHFPAGLLEALRRSGLSVKVARQPFFPERRFKTKEEIAAITDALRLAETGLERGLQVLRASKPGAHGLLHWGQAVLTSERLRGEMDAAIIRGGGLPAGTIVAGGDQACDPHERGRGPLRPHETIILDVFPRMQTTGYFGDLTRTVVRGRASEAARRLYATVQSGKRWIMRQTRAGANGKALHAALLQRFAEAGYPTEERHGRRVGFFHGTGHSLGLEIHEAPRFQAGPLPPGCTMTIEPGLYYPGIGGVRLEDLVLITTTGIRNLTKIEEIFEI
jgi:Xaa-Pro aminopeptidase